MDTHKNVSGLSGNEIFCLGKIGGQAGQLCVGNSVVSIGVGKGIGAGFNTLLGGEVQGITDLVRLGRQKSFSRMMNEAKEDLGRGVTGVSFEMINHGGNLEFITTGSTVHGSPAFADSQMFSTSANAQQLYCQVDAGFKPLHFVFGNVAYSIGVGGNFTGAFRSLVRGEVPQFSKIFDQTRHLALSRIIAEAKNCGANAVIGIETSINPLMGTQEMMMVGTASHHPLLENYGGEPVTSDMTNEEMWNLVNMGYMPLRLVMGVSVYSLGIAGSLTSFLQSLGGGEVNGLTEVLYEAREEALARIQQEASDYGADEVVGVKIKVYQLGGGLVEFLAIGTAVKRIRGATTQSPNLLPQAIIQDRDTFQDFSDIPGAYNIIPRNRTAASARQMQSGPVLIAVILIAIAIYIFKFLMLTRFR